MQGGSDERPAPGQPGAVGELDGPQFAVVCDEAGDQTLVDADSGRVQLLDLSVVQPGVPIGEDHQILGPAAHHQRRVHGTVTLGDHRDRRVAHLPAVAERAVENRSTPQLFEPADVRPPVFHSGGQQHRPGLLAGSVGQLERESRLPAHDFTRAHLHRGVGGQLGAAGGIEVGGRTAVAAQQAADSVCGQVALIPRVDQQYPSPGPAQYQRRTQTGRPASDDDAIPDVFHAFELAQSHGKVPSCFAMEANAAEPADIDALVRGRLRELRRAQRGLTLEDVARRAQIDVSTLSRLESGKRRLALDHLPRLAAALSVTTDELLRAPQAEDPRVTGSSHTHHNITYWPLTRQGPAAGLHAYKIRISAKRRKPPAEFPSTKDATGCTCCPDNCA